jgi:hypothetical protein
VVRPPPQRGRAECRISPSRIGASPGVAPAATGPLRVVEVAPAAWGPSGSSARPRRIGAVRISKPTMAPPDPLHPSPERRLTAVLHLLHSHTEVEVRGSG